MRAAIREGDITQNPTTPWRGGPLSALDKGAPAEAAQIPLQEVGNHHWNILREDIPLPVAVLKDEALRSNSAWMRRFLALTGARIAPHGKTSMAPALFDLQIRDGAWAITLSTPHQIRVARHFGFNRIFLANQLVGRSAIEYVFRALQTDPSLELYCLVDSTALVSQLTAAARRLGARRQLDVLVELGFDNGRTGCRTNAQALSVARAVAESEHLRLCGVEGFEGLIRGPTPQERLQATDAFLTRIVEVAQECSAAGLFGGAEILLSAGGSAYFDRVVEKLSLASLSKPFAVVIRSGCYLTLDSLMYKRAFASLSARAPHLAEQLGELRPALEVWAYVQSRPEQCLVLASLGKRDVSYDDMPLPLAWFRPGFASAPSPLLPGHEVVRLDDQHCYLTVPAESPLQVGDMIGLGVSHPCLTFDKWRVLHRVDDSYNVLDSIRTFF